MRKAEMLAYETRLLELSRRLRGTVEDLDREIGEERAAAGDLAHLGTHNADHDTEFLAADEAAERSEVNLLNSVEAALTRISVGTYGRCEACGDEIPRARLEAVPHAAYCADCERAQE